MNFVWLDRNDTNDFKFTYGLCSTTSQTYNYLLTLFSSYYFYYFACWTWCNYSQFWNHKIFIETKVRVLSLFCEVLSRISCAFIVRWFHFVFVFWTDIPSWRYPVAKTFNEGVECALFLTPICGYYNLWVRTCTCVLLILILDSSYQIKWGHNCF